MKSIRLLIFVLLLPLWACNNTKKDRIKIIEELYSRRFQMDMDDMLIVNPVGSNKEYEYGTYNFVWYVDSGSCSTCALSTLENWDLYLKELRVNYDVGFYPVFFPRKNQSSFFINRAKAQYTEHPIIVDTTGVFKARNEFLPNDQLYNTFLIDSLGNVVIVGTPINNESLQKVILKRLGNKDEAER